MPGPVPGTELTHGWAVKEKGPFGSEGPLLPGRVG